MSSAHSSDSLLAHSLEVSNIPTSPRCSSPEAPQDSSIISYRDLVNALQELEHQVAKFTNRCEQRTVANPTTHADEYSSWTAKDDPDSASSVTLNSNDSAGGLRTYAQHSAASSDATLSLGDNSEEASKEVGIQNLHLVEFGTDTFASKMSTPALSCAEAPSTHDAHTGSTLAASYIPLSPLPLQGCAEEQNLLGPDRFRCEDNYVETGFDVYNADPDPFAFDLYSSAQLALFGDFLRSPFALYTAPASDAIGIDPFDAETHKTPGECDKCLLMEAALSRDFKEPHPYEPWLIERYYDED